MPLLTITATMAIESPAKTQFLEDVAEMYAAIMESETGYVSITFREVSRENVWLGRASESDAAVVLLEADVREGRSIDQRREFALTFMDRVRDEWDLPRSNMKVVFTEHRGTQMMGYDRVGGDWTPDDGLG